jgi:hypothetical protein
LVKKLMPPAGKPPNLVPLTGYIGPSQKADSVRLYSGLDFSSYYEIPKSAIAHTEQTDAEDESSPTTIYIDSGAQLDVVQTTTQSVGASFLGGSITNANLAASATTAAGGTVIHPTTTVLPTFVCSHLPQCRPTLPRPICTEVISVCGICPTRTVIHSACLPCATNPVPCPPTIPAACTHVGICPSSPIICTETIVPSRLVICPTRPIICTETIPVLTAQCPTPNSIACNPQGPGGGGTPVG